MTIVYHTKWGYNMGFLLTISLMQPCSKSLNTSDVTTSADFRADLLFLKKYFGRKLNKGERIPFT